MMYPPLAPVKQTRFSTRPAKLLVVQNRGWPPTKTTVSPKLGVPAPPQLPLSLQYEVVPPPVHVRMLASMRLAHDKTPARMNTVTTRLRIFNAFGVCPGCRFTVSKGPLI